MLRNHPLPRSCVDVRALECPDWIRNVVCFPPYGPIWCLLWSPDQSIMLSGSCNPLLLISRLAVLCHDVFSVWLYSNNHDDHYPDDALAKKNLICFTWLGHTMFVRTLIEGGALLARSPVWNVTSLLLYIYMPKAFLPWTLPQFELVPWHVPIAFENGTRAARSNLGWQLKGNVKHIHDGGSTLLCFIHAYSRRRINTSLSAMHWPSIHAGTVQYHILLSANSASNFW